MKNTKLAILLFVVIGFVLYGNIFGNDFLFDDYSQITDNQYVKDFSLTKIFTTGISSGGGSDSSFYRPIVTLSFAVDYKIWGENPAGFHFINIVLHILSVILIYLIFLSLQSNGAVAFLTSILFLIHPFQIESVTYISGRTDLMPIFFMLLSIFLLIPVFYKKDKKHIFYILSLVSFALALLSKELAVIFPLLLLIIYFTFIEREINKKNIKYIALRLAPFVMLVAGYILLRLNTLPFTGAYVFHQDVWGRILSFLKALLIYWSIIIFPHDLRSRFDQAFIASLPEIIFSILILGLIAFYSIRSLRKERKIFFGFSWFFITLIPASGILIPLYSIISEHWLRMPSIGLFYMASSGTMYFLSRIDQRVFLKKISLVVLIIYLSFLSIITIKTNSLWKNSVSYFSYLLKFYPNEPGIHTNLAIGYEKQGKREEAFREYQKTAELDPGFINAHANLGGYYAERGELDLAVEEYKKTIELDKNFVYAYQALAQINITRGRYDEAIGYLEQLRDLLPNSWKPYSLLGQAHFLKKDYKNSQVNFEKALSLSPKDPNIREMLEVVRARLQLE